MAQLKLSLLGGVTLYKDDVLITGFRSRKAEALLVYLALEKRPFSRTTLATMFWQDSSADQAPTNLRKALHDLRSKVGPWLNITRHTVAFNSKADYWLDTEVVEAGIINHSPHNDTPLTNITAQHLSDALAHYRGPFLAGLHIQAVPDFEEWLILHRERLMLLAHKGLRQLVAHHLAYRDYEAGIIQAKRLLNLNPLDEGTHTILMRLYTRLGHRHLALKQYQQCQRLLQKELGLMPMAATTQLYQRILQAETPAPHQLPTYALPFIGRETALATLSQQLDNRRLLTLVGPGGLGKTRLAVQAASMRQGEYIDGIFFVPLAHINQASLLPTTIATTLGFPQRGKQSPTEQLIDYLHNKELLLILDNFEHLVTDGVAFIHQLLTNAPDVTLLVTSRERLKLRAEWHYTLTGLSYPLPDEASNGHTALKLFHHCAQWAGYTIATNMETAVVRICQLLDGSPLGIELAATSLDSHTPAQIATALQQNLDFLSTEMWDVPARHRTLRAVFQHSWALLTPTEQKVWAQLAVFNGSFDATAALAIAQASRTNLQALSRKSMIQQVGQRYEIHPLLRQYGTERLQQQGQATAVLHQHGLYYATFLQNRMGQLSGGQQKQAIEAIQTESDNIYAAWTWASEQADASILQKALPALSRFLEITGAIQLGAMLWQQPLATMPTTTPLYGRLLTRHGAFQALLGNNETAVAILQQAIPLLTDDPRNHAYALNYLGEAARIQTHYDMAQQYHQQALTLAQTVADAWESNSALRGLGLVAIRFSQYPKARDYLQQSHDLCAATNNQWGRTNRLIMLGMVAYRLGQYEKGQRLLEEAIAHKREFGDLRGLSVALNNLGTITDVLGEYERTKALYKESLKIHQKIGLRWGTAVVLKNLGVVNHRLGDYQAAYDYAQQQLAICTSLQDKQGEADGLTSLGSLATDEGNYEKALDYHQRALAIRQTIGDRRGEGWSWHHLGETSLKQGDFELAQQQFEQSIAIRQAIHDNLGLTHSLTGLAQVHITQGNLAIADEQSRQALTLALDKQTFVVVSNALANMATIHAQRGETKMAVHLATLVAQHPATEYATQTAIWQLLEALGVKRPLPTTLTRQQIQQAIHTYVKKGSTT